MKYGESTEYCGMCIAALASDPDVSQYAGRVTMTCDVGEKYNLKDIDGEQYFISSNYQKKVTSRHQ